jgi:hypothetical protein
MHVADNFKGFFNSQVQLANPTIHVPAAAPQAVPVNAAPVAVPAPVSVAPLVTNKTQRIEGRNRKLKKDYLFM